MNEIPTKVTEQSSSTQPTIIHNTIKLPLPNFTLSTVCPACNAPTYKLACKVRCSRCGFMWDCSEL